MRDINAITSPLLRALNRIRKTLGIMYTPKFRSNFRGVGTGISRLFCAIAVNSVYSFPHIYKIVVNMVVRIRLSRFGNKHQPFYNICVSQARYVKFSHPPHPSALTIHTPPITRNHTNTTASDPPETPNPSKSSEPTTPSPNAPRTSPPNKRATPDHTRRLLSTGHERSTGWVSGRSLVMVCGSC